MSTTQEAVVRRFYEEMCTGRHNEIANELFTDDCQLHDPQIKAGDGPEGMVEVIRTYQDGVDGHWQIDDLFSAGDKVVARWTGRPAAVGTSVTSTAYHPPATRCRRSRRSLFTVWRKARSPRRGRSGTPSASFGSSASDDPRPVPRSVQWASMRQRQPQTAATVR